MTEKDPSEMLEVELVFSKEKLVLAGSYIMYFMRQNLFSVYFWVSVTTRRMVYHVCVGSVVKALRVHEYFM